MIKNNYTLNIIKIKKIYLLFLKKILKFNFFNNYTLKNYIKKNIYLLFLKNHLHLFKCFNKNLDINKLNNLIINKNNMNTKSIKIFKIFNIIKNTKKSNNSYKLLIRFKKYWFKINKKFILKKYISINTIYMWLAYALHTILYTNKKDNFNFKLKLNNFYIKLVDIIKINVDKILNKYQEKISVGFLKKIINNKIYYIIANRIIQTCLKAQIFFIKTKKFRKKSVNYIILNKKIFKNMLSVIEPQSIKIPTLIPIIYTNKDDIEINKNNKYTFKYNLNYLDTLNYLNSQEIIINKDYFNYLCNLKAKDIHKLSKKTINLNLLKNINKKTLYKKTTLNKIIISLIFINNIYIINKYKNYSFYFQYKCDRRGRIYQINWPINSLYNKMLSPLFLFKTYNYNINNNFIPNFDTYYWYLAYNINKNNVLSLRDATNSIFQIAGCLLMDEKMLKYSNIHNEDTRYSIYDYLLDIYKENINLLIVKIKEIYNIDEILILKIKNINRKFFKKTIMTWCYNESYKSSVNKIYNYIFINNETKKWYIDIENIDVKETKKIYFKISQYIYKYIFDNFKINFKPYITLKKLFSLIAKKISNNNNNIIIKHKNNDTHYFEQHHYEQNLKKIYIETFLKKRKLLFIKEINETKWSIKDNKRSLAPNIIQYLDSVIAVEVIKKCKDKSIPIITNHDCFYTTLNNDNNILQIYNNVLKNLFIEHNFLEDIIVENSLSQDLQIKKIYKNILKIREKNISKIKTIFNNDIKYSISVAYKDYNLESYINKNF